MSASHPMELLIQARQSARSRNDPAARYCTLATINEAHSGQPRMRTLVVRDVTQAACLLFVNRQGQKNLHDLPKAKVEVLFFYPSLMAQFRLRGRLSLMSEKALVSHWQHKPYEAKLLDHFYATYLPQSAALQSRTELDEGLDALRQRYPDSDSVPFTRDALGLIVTAGYLEVWQGRDSAIHDRRLFMRHGQVWQEALLVP